MPVGPLIMEFIEFLFLLLASKIDFWPQRPFLSLVGSTDEKCVCNILSDKITCAVGFTEFSYSN